MWSGFIGSLLPFVFVSPSIQLKSPSSPTSTTLPLSGGSTTTTHRRATTQPFPLHSRELTPPPSTAFVFEFSLFYSFSLLQCEPSLSPPSSAIVQPQRNICKPPTTLKLPLRSYGELF